LERIPLERLANFLQNLKTHGPSYRELIEYIKMLNQHPKADPEIQAGETLTHDNMISILQNINTTKSDDANPHLALKKFDVAVLCAFLHLLKYAKVIKRMKQNSHLIQSLFLRN